MEYDPSKNADGDRNRFEETDGERYDRLSPDETMEGIFGDSLIDTIEDMSGGLKKAFDDETALMKKQAE